MMLSSLPTAIANVNLPQAVAARSFARGVWLQDCTAANAFEFCASSKRTPSKRKPSTRKSFTGYRPNRLSNTTLA